MNDSCCDVLRPETEAAVRDLHARYPDAPFLTLGQTVLWDEPLKAAFRRMAQKVAPDARVVAGVHDTDYFAKLSHLDEQDEKFVMLPHNDGDTRDLWSAAGEISSLFGSETVPTRAVLQDNGVAFDRVARSYPGGASKLLNEQTEAWGWRAIVHTEPRPLIAAEVKLSDIGPILDKQLRWAFSESLQVLGKESDVATDSILRWTSEYSKENPNATLSDLYRDLLPRLWNLISGDDLPLETTTSLELFQFNGQTAQKPRFRFVDIFLNPATRNLARRCYDEAVKGSGIYQLSQFGEGALPFDVVIPGKGRGTLRLHDNSLYIETETPIMLCTGCDPDSVGKLASILEEKFGPNVVLVGKAVALISMLSAEFIFVFHEKASGYTARTQQMNDCFRKNGVSLDLKPMLRLEYSTWSSLECSHTTFHLPPHLARAFDTSTISARDFASAWTKVCEDQDALRDQLKNCHSPRDLMSLLAKRDSSWTAKLDEYSQARELMRQMREQTRKLETQIAHLREQAKTSKDEAAQIEHEKGNDWRQNVQPLRVQLMDLREAATHRADENAAKKLSKDERKALQELEAQEELQISELRERIAWQLKERARFDDAIAEKRNRARELSTQSRELTQQKVALEKSDEAKRARAIINELEYEAEWQRFQLVRDALSVSKGLGYTNLRPTGWWLPLVSPDGSWFKRLVNTAKARIEEL